MRMADDKKSRDEDVPPLVRNLMEGMDDLGFTVGDKLAFINLLHETKDSPITKKFLEKMDHEPTEIKPKKIEGGNKGKER